MSNRAKELAKNPLIGSYPTETLDNVVDALEYMQSVAIGTTGTRFNISDKATTGFYFLMRCIQGATEYESLRTKELRKEANNDEL